MPVCVLPSLNPVVDPLMPVGPPVMPETAVADAIQKRTEEHLRKQGGIAVSSKPIVMRAE